MGFDSREFEFADIKVALLGVELSGLRGLMYKEKQSKEPVYGAGNKPRSIQRGNFEYDGSLMLLKSDQDILNAAARDAGYSSMINVPPKLINITCVYQQQEDSTVLSVDTMIGVAFTEREDGMKQGDKFKEITMPFVFLSLKQA